MIRQLECYSLLGGGRPSSKAELELGVPTAQAEPSTRRRGLIPADGGGEAFRGRIKIAPRFRYVAEVRKLGTHLAADVA